MSSRSYGKKTVSTRDLAVKRLDSNHHRAHYDVEMLSSITIDVCKHCANTENTAFHLDLRGGTAKTVLYSAGFDARYHVEKNNRTHISKQCVDGMLSFVVARILKVAKSMRLVRAGKIVILRIGFGCFPQMTPTIPLFHLAQTIQYST